MQTENSFSSIIEKFVLLQNNALSVLQAFEESTDSMDAFVNIKLKDGDNEYTRKILSQNYIKKNFDRIDATISKLSGLESSAFIKLKDGTTRQIITYDLLAPNHKVLNFEIDEFIKTKESFKIDDLTSNESFISIDLTDSIQKNSKKIKFNKLFLFDDSLNYQDELQKKETLNYLTIKSELEKKNLKYSERIETKKLEVLNQKYKGNFNIIKVIDSPISTNGVSVTETSKNSTEKETTFVKRYLFEKITYDDLETNSKVYLKTGDLLKINDSIYEIESVDKTTNLIGMHNISGLSIIPFLSPDKVSFYNKETNTKKVNIPINADEKFILFIKDISEISNIESIEYSDGILIDANLLKMDFDKETNFKEYFDLNTHNYGKFIKQSTKDGKISLNEGIKPDVPILNQNDFKVVEINDHIIKSSTKEEIEDKTSQKISIESEIKSIDKSIKNKRTLLDSKSFESNEDKERHQSELESLIRNRESKNSLYSSLITDLSLSAKRLKGIKKKYRVRGFFEIPKEKSINGTPQQNVQFNIRYKYLNSDFDNTNVKQFKLNTSENKELNGAFSPWVLVKSKSREKIFNIDNDRWEWKNENIEDSNEININQIDVPITRGETVEIQIQTVSEAGFPENPLVSDWSESLIVEFNNDLSDTSPVDITIENAELEALKVEFKNEMDIAGVYKHLTDNNFLENHYYAHNLDNILSGIFDENGKNLSTFDVIKRLTSRINELEKKIENVKGELSISIIDIAKNETNKVNRNSVIKLFAGYYENEISQLSESERDGAIITKQYNLVLTNNGGESIFLVSRFPGGNSEFLPNSTSQEINDTDYNLRRMYDRVPIVYNNITKSETLNGAKLSQNGYMSQQNKSQFLYLRYKDIGLMNDLYFSVSDQERILKPIISGETNNNIWNFDFQSNGTPNGNGNISEFCVSMDYPDFDVILSKLQNLNVNSQNKNEVFTELETPNLRNGEQVVSEFSHIYGFNLTLSENTTLSQLEYKFYDISNQGTSLNIYEYPTKFGFKQNDRYLIGKKTCGSYLFLQPDNFEQIQVNGLDYIANEEIKSNGDGIIIPFIFQYRMSDYLNYNGGWEQNFSEKPNIFYKKKIGIDINIKDESTFSFDIEVAAHLKQTTSNIISNLNINQNNTTIK